MQLHCYDRLDICYQTANALVLQAVIDGVIWQLPAGFECM